MEKITITFNEYFNEDAFNPRLLEYGCKNPEKFLNDLQRDFSVKYGEEVNTLILLKDELNIIPRLREKGRREIRLRALFKIYNEKIKNNVPKEYKNIFDRLKIMIEQKRNNRPRLGMYDDGVYYLENDPKGFLNFLKFVKNMLLTTSAEERGKLIVKAFSAVC